MIAITEHRRTIPGHRPEPAVATRTMDYLMAQSDDRQQFVDAVRARLDTSMADAGFPLNGVYGDDAEAPNRNSSVLYEGVVADFLVRYPGIDPVWDEGWRRRADGCVDLWIKWSETDNSINVNLEHWTIHRLAERYANESSMRAVEAALSGSGDMQARVEVIAEVLERSLAAASAR